MDVVWDRVFPYVKETGDDWLPTVVLSGSPQGPHAFLNHHTRAFAYFWVASLLGLGIYRYKLHQTGGECSWQAGVSVLIGACSAVDIGLVGGYHLASIQEVLGL